MYIKNKELTSEFSKNPDLKKKRISKDCLHEVYRLEKIVSSIIVYFLLQQHHLFWSVLQYGDLNAN